MPDPVPITLDRADWQALLDAVPVEKLTYGSALWGVYQDVQRALKGICGATWPKDPKLVCVRPQGHRGGHSYDKPTEGS